ncbi:hypothetical protein BDV25DRAFT_154816 [Aspergillus avenaceus]|uniref:Ankyrin repeat-containing domain protein n=1 Tax=Aspergillus avenaceus TaxID=36643 RepID=A0A5N6TV24_ASPAV|nr:hypothetical protein BDV25DRAFT_154816 [Aspergillus avenaceus]
MFDCLGISLLIPQPILTRSQGWLYDYTRTTSPDYQIVIGYPSDNDTMARVDLLPPRELLSHLQRSPMLAYLLSHNYVTQKDGNGLTLLHHIAINRVTDEHIVGGVLSNRHTLLEPQDNDGCTPIWHAAFHGNELLVGRLIDMGVRLDTGQNISLDYHFHHYGPHHICPIEVDEPTLTKTTPLLVAAMNGHTVVVSRITTNIR